MTIVNRVMQRARDVVRGFASDARGNVAMISAFVIPVLLLITFGGIDIHRASTVKANLQDALDAATLAAARSQYTDDTNITRIGVASLQANLAPFKDIALQSGTTFKLNPTTGAVVGDAKVDVTALVGAIVLPRTGAATAGTIPVSGHSEVLRSNLRIEVALVIDNTGSMGQDNKLQNTQEAAINLLNRLEAADARSIEEDAIKVSLVPFSQTVRIAQGGSTSRPSYMSNAADHTGGTGTYGIFDEGIGRFDVLSRLGTTWGGCVEARAQPHDIRDTAPSSANQATMFVPYFAPDEPDRNDYRYHSTWYNWQYEDNNYLDDGRPGSTSSSPFRTVAERTTEWFARVKSLDKYVRTNGLNTVLGPNKGCDIEPVIRLTNDYDALRRAVGRMVASGNTNVPLGAMWGWHTLSDTGPFGDGRRYNEERLQKIIIIMTDGENVLGDTNSPNDSPYNGLGYIWQDRLGITSGNAATRRSRMDNRMDNANASAEDLCGNMKAPSKNIEIYTIAVQVDSTAQAVLRRCATDDEHYYPVSSSGGIADAFDRIAGRIENLRISR